MSTVIKIKCVNFDNISDSCDKFNFITNYTYFIITNTYYIKTYTNITNFNTFDETADLRICV